jgi:RNA methyltransferase, TrmH family
VADITSRHHSIVRAFRSAARGDARTALLDGWHLLHDAAAAGVDIVTVAFAGVPPSPADAALIDQLARRCDVLQVTPRVMDAISPVRTPTGVAALIARREHALHDVLRRQPALVIVAADIQDPGNVGAIVRSAEAGGATGVLLLGASADPWSWKALRAAMGSTFRLPVARAGAGTAAADLHGAGLKLIATVPRGGTAMHEIDMRVPLAIVVGAEGAGVDAALLSAADERLTIPMQAPVESLNVAVAAGVLVYEARRQREA